jgi:mannose-6-phosphate isomerase-like protein (cupin superfamily)
MQARTTFFVAGCFGAVATLAVTLAAQNGTAKSNWTVRINETRGPVRAVSITASVTTATTEILSGPTNGSDNAYLMFTRLPAGGRGPAMSTLPDDHLMLVLEGQLNIQIGTDTFVVEKNQAACIPRLVPHEIWNDGPEPEAHFDVIAPGSSRDLKSMFKAAQPRKVENAAQYIRTTKVPAQTDMKSGLNGATFAERKLGYNEQLRIDSTLPGQGGPKPHIHKFEQVYFSIEGETTLTYGLLTYPLPKYSVGVIQPGAVHTNNNRTSAVERHITVLLPEPLDRSEPLDIEVELKGGVGTAQR